MRLKRFFLLAVATSSGLISFVGCGGVSDPDAGRGEGGPSPDAGSDGGRAPDARSDGGADGAIDDASSDGGDVDGGGLDAGSDGGGDPGPDTCASRGTFTVPVAGTVGHISGDTTHASDTFTLATPRPPRCNLSQAALAPDHVWELVVPNDERVRIETVGPTAHDTVLYVQAEGCTEGASSPIACADEGGATFGFSRIERAFTAGTYYLVVDGYGGGRGPYELEVEARDEPAADGCVAQGTFTVPAFGASVVSTGDTTEANDDFTLADPRPTACSLSSSSIAPDHVYAFTVATAVRLRIESLAPTAHDTGLYVLSGACTDGAVTPLHCDEDGGEGSLSRIQAVFEPGSYFLVVDGYSGGAGPYSIVIEASDPADTGRTAARAQSPSRSPRPARPRSP